MAFGLPSAGGGDIVPIVKFNAKEKKMIRVDREATSDGWESNEVDITNKFSGVFDLENILVGWVYFSPTSGPQRVMSNFPKEPLPARPADLDASGKPLYKQGFSVRIALAKSCGGGLREFSGNAVAIVESMGELHDKYMKAPERNDGKLPIVKLVGVTPIPGKFGTNYRPNFEITGWVDRPEVLTTTKTNGATKPAQDTFTTSVPPSTGSTVKAPPARAAMSAPEPEATADDFG